MRTGMLVVVVLAGCNQLLGLDATDPSLGPPPDLDADGVLDADDNCVAAANADQRDGDRDGYGDACDRCAALATSRNHDEDGDRRGDECDLCPITPDLAEDGDGDGVGDRCEFSTSAVATTLVLFDPFVAIDPAWQTAGVPWISADDAIRPTGDATPGDPGLGRPDLVLADAPWKLEIGVVSSRRWEAGDQFGLGIADAEGVVASCRVGCDAQGCTLAMVRRGQAATSTAVQAQAVLTAALIRAPGGQLICVVGGVAVSIPSGAGGTPVLYGAPALAISYFGAWSEP